MPALALAGFTDRTAQVAPGMGGGNAAWCDYNGDGYSDISLTGGVLKNNGGTSFTSAGFGVGWAVWGDCDNDGDQDAFRFDGSTTEVRLIDGAGIGQVITLPTPAGNDNRGAVWGDFNGDGYLDMYLGAYEANGYEPDSVYINQGNNTWTRPWIETPVPQPGGYNPATFPGRGVTACDFDEDGDLDVHVSNYRLEQNYLWLNDGNANFTDVGAARGIGGIDDGWRWSKGHTIGSCWGDMDNDGHIDLFTGNFSHPDTWQDRARFHRNLGPAGNWHFSETWVLDGGDWQESYASPSLADYDNDGDLDLYFTTVYGGDNARLYRNNGNWSFSNVTSAEGLAGMPPTYQSAWGDFNNDGFLDLITAGRLYENNGNGNHWLRIRLEGNGTSVNRSAIGAQVRIDLGGGTILTRQVEAGTGEGNQNELTLHFGLGSRTAPVTLDISWPDGTTQIVQNVAVDQTIDQFQIPPEFDLAWGASTGVFFPSLGEGILPAMGDEVLAQLYLAPDNQIDDTILPGGAADNNDFVLDSVLVRNNGGHAEDFAAFQRQYQAPFQDGTLYMVIFSSDSPVGGDRYYRSPGMPAGDAALLTGLFDMNVGPESGNTWTGTVLTPDPYLDVSWFASWGFIDSQGNPILPSVGNEALVQLIYSPDGVADALLPNGIPDNNDVVIDARLVRNNGGQFEDYAFFGYYFYEGLFESGFIYGVIYDSGTPRANDDFYVGPMEATVQSVRSSPQRINYDFNTDPVNGNSWNGTVVDQPYMLVDWRGSAGFIDDQGNPILPNIGDEALVQLIYSPDGVADSILPGALMADDDVVIDTGIVRNNGGLWEEYGLFNWIRHEGPYFPGFIYAVIYENTDPQAGARYYTGPLQAAVQTPSGSPIATSYEMNIDFVLGDAWNGSVVSPQMHIDWSASIGFIDGQGDPILPDGGDQTLIQMFHTPDAVPDQIYTGGAASGNDTLLHGALVQNGGGFREEYCFFGPLPVSGNYQAGYIYGVVYEDDTPGAGDRYYAGPLRATSVGDAFNPDAYEMNSNLVDGNTWNRTVAGTGSMDISWYGSAGFFDENDNPILPFVGDETAVQLIYSPDAERDPILPGGVPGGNDAVLAADTVRNNGGQFENWGFFGINYFSGVYQAGFIYCIIYEDADPQAGDQYFAGPLTATSTGNGTPAYNLNTDLVNGNTWNDSVIGENETLDYDLDGLPNDFETIHFGDATVAEANVDSDLDGLSNFKEHIAGTDPMNAGSFFGIESISQNASDVVVILRDTSVNRGYVLEFNDGMSGAGSWSATDGAAAGTGGGIECIDSGGAADPTRVYRGKVYIP
jgi:hypothetical protein